MASWHVRLFFLLVIPIIATALIEHGAQSDLNEAITDPRKGENYENGYQTTEVPNIKQSSSNTADHETPGKKSTMNRMEKTDTTVKSSEIMLSVYLFFEYLRKTVMGLLFSNKSPRKLEFEECRRQLKENRRWRHVSHPEYQFYLSSLDARNFVHHPDTGEITQNNFTWWEAQKFCRRICKEVFTLDSLYKANFITSVFRTEKMPGLWTSKRGCDLSGCQNHDDGHASRWFWNGNDEDVDTGIKQKTSDWELYFNETNFTSGEVNETCVALLNNVNKSGLIIRDLPCNKEFFVLCEKPRGL